MHIVPYTRDICDRLIRHLEVRREDYLPFWAATRPGDASDELEKLRFTLALLDASFHFADDRYLNAALKANDWHFRRLGSKLPSTREPAGELVAVFYLASLSQQENLVRALSQ